MLEDTLKEQKRKLVQQFQRTNDKFFQCCWPIQACLFANHTIVLIYYFLEIKKICPKFDKNYMTITKL